jgi:LacI family transcriptional regulator
MLREGHMLELIRGVLDFAEHAEHWQFAGPAHRLFIKREQIDPAVVDGVIGGFYEAGWTQPVLDAGLAAVDIISEGAHAPFPRVCGDHHAIGRMGGEHLLERGFANYAFIQWQGAPASTQRFEGFCEALDEAGRTCATITGYDYRHEVIRDALRDWLAGLPKPVAIMTANDHLGTHAIGLADELGLRVPEDVAVLSTENAPWPTTLSMPPMSSVQPDDRQLGFRAAEALDQLMAGISPPPLQRIAPIGVVTRGSTDIVLVDDPMVSKTLAFIDQHCSEPIDVEDVAEAMDTSRRTLENRMKKAIGQTPKTAIDRARIDLAKKQLITTDLPMDQIAPACGYERADRFYVVFKRIAGMTPGQYRHQRGVSR